MLQRKLDSPVVLLGKAFRVNNLLEHVNQVVVLAMDITNDNNRVFNLF
jgi:hypothetical protein